MSPLTPAERMELDELQFLTLEGLDQEQRRVVRVVGNFFPDAEFSKQKLQSYILKKLNSAASHHSGFVIVYFQTEVESGHRNPGLLHLRWLYEMLPSESKKALKSIYFVHPGFQSKILLGALGWLLSERCYYKLKCIDRVEFLWGHLNPEQLRVPEFVWDHDDHLEHRELGLSSDRFPHIHPHCVS